MNAVLHSSKEMNWRTPPDVFQAIEQLSSNPFTIDAAAQKGHELVAKAFGPGQPRADALSPLSWGERSDRVWLNPPHGRAIGQFTERACHAANADGVTVWLLVPARTDTAWWNDMIVCASQVWFVRGRITFLEAANGKPKKDAKGVGMAAGFPSAVVVLRGNAPPTPVCTFNWRPW